MMYFPCAHRQTGNWYFPTSQKVISPKEVSLLTCQLRDKNTKKQISIFDPIFVTFQMYKQILIFPFILSNFISLSESQELIHIGRIFSACLQTGTPSCEEVYLWAGIYEMDHNKYAVTFQTKSEMVHLEIQCLSKLLSKQNNIPLTIIKTLHL